MEMLKLNIYCHICLIAFIACTVQARSVRKVALTNGWTLSNANSTVQIAVPQVPSGVYTALQAAYGDLLQGRNDVALRWIAEEPWTYSTIFDGDEFGVEQMVNLTFHGLDTLAKLWLNGELLGETDNMFVRYSYEVGHLLRAKSNLLQIELLSPLQQATALAEQLEQEGKGAPPYCLGGSDAAECHRNMLRKMQMSFGGPFNPVAASMGIWKPVELEYYEVAVLRDVDVAIMRNESHWTMDCRAFLSTSEANSFYAHLEVYSSQLLDEPFLVQQQLLRSSSNALEFRIYIPQERVSPWWPNGYGQPNLYPVFFNLKSYRTAAGPEWENRTSSQKVLKIGFRTIELVEDEDDRGRTFFFRVNDQPIFVKGANYVPAHTLPELAGEMDAVSHLLHSAQGAHMNMIRVWGGGIYESDYFYELADSLGLLIWQDMAFSAATYPVTEKLEASMRKETSQNARRLAYHPSLALIVTNNEIELYLFKNRSDFASEAQRLEENYRLLFMGTIKNELSIISRNSFNPRPGPMVSTPSLGIEMSSKELSQDPQNPNYGDVHFWGEDQDGFGPDTYPRGRFISEFGYASLPSRSSWRRALAPDDNDTDSSVAALMRHRQHDSKGFDPLLDLISHQLPFLDDPDNWDDHIDQFIYFSQVAQAMTAKTAVDLFRSLRSDNQTMGALIWQLNDVWVAPTWSCIDFYGNYKLVYYWARDFLAPFNVIGLYDKSNDIINITLTREGNAEQSGAHLYNVVVETYIWSALFPQKTIARANVLDNNGILQLKIPLESVLYEEHTKAETFLKISMEDENKDIVASTYLYPMAIKDVVGMRDPQLTIDVLENGCKSPTYINSFSLRIAVKYPALIVYLELDNMEFAAQKHAFSVNGFTQTEPVKIVHLEFKNNSACLALKEAHIKVKTINQYMV